MHASVVVHEVRSIFSASPSSELLNLNHTRIDKSTSVLQIRSSLRSVFHDETNFGFGTLAFYSITMRGAGLLAAPVVMNIQSLRAISM